MNARTIEYISLINWKSLYITGENGQNTEVLETFLSKMLKGESKNV